MCKTGRPKLVNGVGIYDAVGANWYKLAPLNSTNAGFAMSRVEQAQGRLCSHANLKDLRPTPSGYLILVAVQGHRR
jgi:hypothetical protein